MLPLDIRELRSYMRVRTMHYAVVRTTAPTVYAQGIGAHKRGNCIPYYSTHRQECGAPPSPCALRAAPVYELRSSSASPCARPLYILTPLCGGV